ncbi:hypothetical protein [Halobacillus litoralis]|uniref:hypothetical protein n=1 Tax=Halobacillus litoralis TaxID=45668 RepID=UPI001CD4D4D5|nr:hypothetical protein [Halobacillus litoralis]MCA1023803.1 hypothetical protein [Halobacillus litoralis]
MMFLIERTRNGKVETLKDSSSHLTKKFATLWEAETFCTKLNRVIDSDKQWEVKKSRFA